MKCKCHTSHWNFAIVQWVADEICELSLSFYPCPNIPDTFVGDEMNGCQSCSVLFHKRSNRKHGKWKWTDKPDIWPPCSIQKWGEIFVKHFFRLWMQFSPTRGCFSQMFKKQISKHSSKQICWHQFCLWKTPSSRCFLFPLFACLYFS